MSISNLFDNKKYIPSFEKLYIETANKAAQEFKYGDTISKQWIIENFKLKKPSVGTQKQFEDYAFELLGMTEGFKKHLLEIHKMHLVSIRGNGYSIAMPENQADIAMNKLRKSVSSELNKAANIIANINDSLLTDEQAKKRDSEHGRLAAFTAFSRNKLLA